MDRDERTLQLLHRLILPLDRVVQVADRETGHGSAQLSALAVIHYIGASSISTLAEIERISAPSASRVVEGLVRDGLVAREADTNDRRIQRLVATSKGQNIVKQACDRRAAHLGQALADLTEEEWSALATATRAINRVFRYDRRVT